MNTQPATVWTALVEPTEELGLQLLFQPAGADVVDASPLTLDGGVTVWFDPLLPAQPQRMLIPDFRQAAFCLAPLLGEQAFNAVREVFRALSEGAEQQQHERSVTVHQSPQWDNLARWALAQWLRDDVPTELDPGLLDIEIASSASAVATLLSQTDLDRLERLWHSVTERLLVLGRRCLHFPFSDVAHPGVVDLVGRAVHAAAGFLDPDDDERTSALVVLAASFPAADDRTRLDQWLDQAYVDAVFSTMIEELAAAAPGEFPTIGAPHLAQHELAATLSAEGTPAASPVLSATDSVDWWQIPPRTLAGDDESTVQWTWNSSTRQLQVQVPADRRAVQDGRWRFDLRFRLIHDDDPTPLATGPLIPRVADGIYGGEVPAPLTDGDVVVDVYACPDGAEPAPALGNTRRRRAARREAARGVATCRRLRLLHGIERTDRQHPAYTTTAPTGGGLLDDAADAAQQVEFILASRADTAWQAAAAGNAQIDQHDAALRCLEQVHAPTDQPLLGAEEPTLAEYDLLGLLED